MPWCFSSTAASSAVSSASWPTSRRRGSRTAVVAGVLAALAGLVAGCTSGSATIRIDQGERIVDDTVREIAARLELDVESEVELGARRPCDLPGGRDGASNTVSLQGRSDVDDPLGVSAAVLVEREFELIDDGGPDLLYGRQAGIRVTVDQGGDDRIAIDGATGCRPPEEP